MSDRHAHLTFMDAKARGSELEPLMSIETFAEYLGVPAKTIYDWRLSGKGPRALRIGRHLKVATSDVQAWLEAQREPSPGVAPEGR